MTPAARPRWGWLAAQLLITFLGVVVGVFLLVAPGGDGPVRWVLAVAVALGTVALVAWLELVKTRRIVEGLTGGFEGPQAGNHADRVRQLTASRRVIVEAFEIERSRIERDLHDGAQQYLVAASLKVGEAALALDGVVVDPTREGGADVRAKRTAARLLDQAQDDTAAALAALRETVAGVHSRLLAEQGLEPALRELVARFADHGQPVTLRIPHPLPPLPPGVASAAWFLVSEALTNATKYAPGAPVSVAVLADSTLHVSVVDEGPGGATPTQGHGLEGMRERLRAFGGELRLTSPLGGPTTVSASIPLLLRTGERTWVEDPTDTITTGEIA